MTRRARLGSALSLALLSSAASAQLTPSFTIDSSGAARTLRESDSSSPGTSVALGAVTVPTLTSPAPLFVADGTQRDPDKTAIGTSLAVPTSGDYGYALASIPTGNYMNAFFTTALPTGASIVRSSCVGTLNLQALVTADRIDCLGQGALRWGRYLSRETAIGSLSMQWLGDDISLLATHHQDMWDPLANTTGGVWKKPGDAGWNWDGLETLDSGIGTKIAAVTTSAASGTDTIGNTGVGRDTLNEIVLGTYNSAFGYKALQDLYSANNNIGAGSYACRHLVFGDRNACYGTNAGANAVEANRNVFLGPYSGQDLRVGDNNDFIGGYAGSTSGATWTSVNNVWMGGHGAGEGITPYDYAFLVQNGSGSRPVLQGNMQTGALYGIWKAVGASGVAASTNATTETTLATIQLPGHALGPNGMLRVSFLLSATASASTKTIQVRAGGLLGTIVSTTTMTTDGTKRITVNMQNANSETSNISDTLGALSVDTTTARSIVITAKSTSGTDTETLQDYLVEAIYMP